MKKAKAEQQWKPGDVVRLKSGGPKMTVIGTTTRKESEETKAYLAWVECVWFGVEGRNSAVAITHDALRGDFQVDTLVRAR